MKTKTDKKLHDAVEALQAYLDMRLENDGGYPADIDSMTIPGYVVVANVDHDEAPVVSVYTHAKLLDWHRRAKSFSA